MPPLGTPQSRGSSRRLFSYLFVATMVALLTSMTQMGKLLGGGTIAEVGSVKPAHQGGVHDGAKIPDATSARAATTVGATNDYQARPNADDGGRLPSQPLPLPGEPANDIWDWRKARQQDNGGEKNHDLEDEINAIPQCAALGTKFTHYLATYVANVEKADPSGGGKQDKEGARWGPLHRLIYSCEADKKGLFCGGMGDRFRGMISTFFLALLTRRRFELYHAIPSFLQQHLHPNLYNWVPSVPSMASSSETISLKDVQREMDKFSPNTQMMRLKGHNKFLGGLWGRESGAAWAEGKDDTMRAQSNSFGVDGFLHKVPGLQKAKTELLGLPQRCNITCYFGCLHAVLFKPSKTLRDAAAVVLAPAIQDGMSAAGSLGFSRSSLITVQVRMGGDWAGGMRIKEPFRTHPDAVKHFFSVLKELRSGDVPGQKALKDAKLFVSSDSERFINESKKEFGAENVLSVPGGFQHTDTIDLSKVRPEKYAAFTEEVKRHEYFQTMLNHYLIGEGDHTVMAQSGFGDTGFWRGRRSATGLFVDMNNYRYAWEHHQTYKLPSNSGESQLWTDRDKTAYRRIIEEGQQVGLPAMPIRNRIIDIRAKPSRLYPQE